MFETKTKVKSNNVRSVRCLGPLNAVEPRDSIDTLPTFTNRGLKNYDTLVDPKATITFLGRNITSKFGIQLFKFMSIIVPLLPTFALVLYNGIQLESLITRSNLLAESFEQVSEVEFHNGPNYFCNRISNYIAKMI